MRGRRGAVFVTACVLGAGLALPVRADVVSAGDPQGDNGGYDEAGDPTAGRLDIARLEHSHAEAGYLQDDYLVHTIETYDDWDNAALAPRSPLSLSVTMRHEGGSSTAVLEQRPDGSLTARVHLSEGGRESFQAGFADVWRVDPRTVAIALTKSQIWPGHADLLREYSWSARSSDNDCTNASGDVISFCSDGAPDRGDLRHVVLGPGSSDCRDGADNDGDGRTDDDDAGCASPDDSFEGHSDAEGDCDRTTCETPGFTLRLDRERQVFRGRVRTSLKGCLSERTVYLYRLARGHDRPVTRSGARENGRWFDFFPDRGGRYYVIVLPVEKEWETDWVRCARIASNVVRFRP